MYLRGQFYTDSNIILDPATIGTDQEALICVTNIMECCQSGDTGTSSGAGSWYGPDGDAILFGALNDPYMSRGASTVMLNANTPLTSGLYRCQIPSSDGVTDIYVGLYPPGEGD